MTGTEVSMYYLDGCPFVWKPAQVIDDFEDMSRMGADSVCISILEQDHSDNFKNKVQIAHDAGLKVYAIPSRVGGLLAGTPRVPSMFCARNLDTLMMTKEGLPQDATAGVVCCANNPKFQEWFLDWTEKLVTESKVDGIVFDEPKEAHKPCYCKVCLELCREHSDEALTRFREDSVAGIIGKTCTLLKQLSESLKTILFVMPDATDNFVNQLLAQKDLDYFGNDGLMELKRMDTSLFEKARAAAKKTFTLLETFHLRENAIRRLPQEFERVRKLGIDMYAFYYYGPSNEKPAEVMKLTAEAIQKFKS